MVSEKPSDMNGVDSLAALHSLVKELRKKDPEQAKKLQKKLKKKKNKLNHQRKEIEEEEEKEKEKEKGKEKGKTVKNEKRLNDENEEEDFDEESLQGVEVEYVVPSLDELTNENEAAESFVEVFEKFCFEEKEEEEENEETAKINFKEEEKDDKNKLTDDEEDEEDDKPKISKKKLKQMSRYSLAQLKQLAPRPDVVEVYDRTASDAVFLVFLKGYRNTAPVPPHWAQKRKYMQGKRGIEKPPFKLPSYIEATKIAEIRQAIQEKEAQKTMRQKQREKVRPKMHRMDIDYQVLHDAFFKYATKPKLTRFGDVYYEGKENELKMRKFKPGVYSDTLREALGMGENAPPPWLINMQRYGPPLRYSGLKIPGLNAPIPAGAEYGYHPGGWGKPPVDEFGNPLYGDFDMESRENAPYEFDEGHWGEIQNEDEEEEEEEEETAEAPQRGMGEGEGTKTPASVLGLETPVGLGGMVTEASGLRSITSGVETPESVDIRKRGFNTATPKPYTILQQQHAPAQPGALFASNITYKIPNRNVQGPPGHVTPIGGMATPGGTITPNVGGVVTPYGGGLVTPYGGGVVTPYGNLGTGGTVTPALMGDGGPGGIGGLQTPVSGRPGPGGLTVSLNPSEMEQEGVFAADVIRHQLKQHEEAALRAKQAAGQIDPHEARKRKGDSTGEAAAKKKKKEKFKF